MKNFIKSAAKTVCIPMSVIVGLCAPALLALTTIRLTVASPQELSEYWIVAMLLVYALFSLTGILTGILAGFMTNSAIDNLWHLPQIFSRRERCKILGTIGNLLVTIIIRYRMNNQAFASNIDEKSMLVYLLPFWGVAYVKENEVVAIGKFSTPFSIGEFHGREFCLEAAQDNRIVVSVRMQAWNQWGAKIYWLLTIDDRTVKKEQLCQLSFDCDAPTIGFTEEGIIAKTKLSNNEESSCSLRAS